MHVRDNNKFVYLNVIHLFLRINSELRTNVLRIVSNLHAILSCCFNFTSVEIHEKEYSMDKY